MNWQLLIGIGVAFVGLLWFLLPNLQIPWPRPSPEPGPQPLAKLDRVQVFATLDAMRKWFAEQGNTAGVNAMVAGSQALIEDGKTQGGSDA